jgi:hypothetical protein
MKKTVLLLFAVVFMASYCYAQSSRMFIPLDIKKAYDNGTRSLDGKPGPNYWQNSSDYKISTELDPVKLVLSGSEVITYKNNSPKKLNMLVIRLYQDILRKEAARDSQANPDDLSDGVTITKLIVNGEAVELDPKKPFAARKNGTNLIVTLKNPIQTKTESKIEVEWSFPIPKKTQMRMGMYTPTTFFMAYFYPQIAVYDDYDGWDRHQYKGTAEFYNDFNNYDVNITVPANYVVWATGLLQNGKDNFTKETWNKVEEAKTSEKVVNIIKKEDIEKKNILKEESKTTWHYIAENVTDFAFATGSEMQWDASTVKLPNGKETFVSSIYNKDAKNCEEVADYARRAIIHFSTNMPGVPFPYPSMTVFNHGGGGGMEFPMMTNDGISTDKTTNVMVTVHEIAHTYMPFYMGINERKYAWMDEGWATMFTYDGQESILPETKPRNGDGMQLSYMLGNEDELPPTIPSNITASGDGMTYNIASYPRPGMAYDLLRKVLGEELFKKALHEYIDRWHGKHPLPHDFFYTFNQVAGEDLEWFWVPWFYERGYADLAIKDVSVYEGTYKTTIQKEGVLPVPIVVKYTYEDNTSEEVTRPITMWKGGNNECVVEYKPAKKVVKIEIGAPSIPDANKKNNKYEFSSSAATPKANFKDYEGTYELGQMTLVITVEDNKLIAEANGQAKVELTNLKGDEFEVTGVPASVKFVRNENKKVTAVEVNQNGNVSTAKKIN